MTILLPQTDLYRVEDADLPGLNGFYRDAEGRIHEQTLATLFYDPRAAKFFATTCQQQFPYSVVVVMRSSFWLDEQQAWRSKGDVFWRVPSPSPK